jgi:beta-lactamase class A
MWFEQAKEVIEKIDGDIGLLVKNLDTGETFSHQEDVVFPSASTIKVPILISLMDAVAEGKFDLNAPAPIPAGQVAGGCGIIQLLSEEIPFTLLDHAKMMIVLSDNAATNQLIATLGIDEINATCQKLGLKDTILGRKMMDFEAKLQGKDNFTSCQDMLTIFELLHRNPQQYDTAIQILKEQMLNDLLPTYTDRESYAFAHKTGELPGIRHDVGIMYLDAPIFVAFLSKNLSDEFAGIRLANELGVLILNAFRTK